MPTKQEIKETVVGFVVLAALGYGGWKWLTSGDAEVQPIAATSAASSTQAPSGGTSTDLPSTVADAPEPVVAEPPGPSAEEIAEKEKAQRYGHHCLSVWDGSHPAFIRAVERQLNDPDSFDHVETITWPVRDDGRNTIVMQFTAKNGFGGVVRGKASGSFSNAACDDVQLDLVE